VGETWPDGIAVDTETVAAHEAELKTGVIVATVVFCCALIAALTIHAMAVGNQQRVDRVLDTAWKVLIGFGVWAVAARRWDKVRAVLRKAVHSLKE
jgi:NADH:ubiquinone oxidoreductase subunit H